MTKKRHHEKKREHSSTNIRQYGTFNLDRVMQIEIRTKFALDYGNKINLPNKNVDISSLVKPHYFQFAFLENFVYKNNKNQ